MDTRTWRWLALATAAAWAIPQGAWAWHGKGHHRATRLAVSALPKEMPRFFLDGADTAAHCALDPDLFTKPIGPKDLHAAESPEHYFDMERLEGAPVPPGRYDLLSLCGKKGISPSKVGLVPYAITEWTRRLTVAFAEHRKWPDNPHVRAKCLVYAGICAHYAQDLCQPLHTTIHYDGRVGKDGVSPRSGIHMKVDALLGKVPADAKVRLGAKGPRPFTDLFPAVVAELKASHALVDRVYALEKSLPAYADPLPAKGAVAEFTLERLRASVSFTARLYATGWQDSAGIKFPKWHVRPADAAAPPVRAAAPPPAPAAPAKSPAKSAAGPAGAEQVRLATYNIEQFMKMFDQNRMPRRSQNREELFRDEEDLYEVARTIRLGRFDADILGIQECCTQPMLEQFNRRWLGGKYAFVKVFPGNVEGMHVGMLAKAGFEVLEVRDKYYLDKDPVDDSQLRAMRRQEGIAEDRLFSRGPAFVKFRTPGGSVLWVGCTHAKSKFRNSKAATRWRVRDIQRTRQICGELIAAGTDKLVMLGDFNDDFGMDEHEKALGVDAVETFLAGRGAEKLLCLTRPLLAKDPSLASYHCQIKPPKYRSFLDHVFVSPALARFVGRTYLVDDPVAAVASDHYPVVTILNLPKAAPAKGK